MPAGIVIIPAAAGGGFWFADVIAANSQVTHQDSLGQGAGHLKIGAQFFFFLTAIAGDAGVDPGGVMTRDIGAGYPFEGLRNDGLGGTGRREQLRVTAVGCAHHLSLGADEVCSVIAFTENFAWTELFGSFRLDTSVHPM